MSRTLNVASIFRENRKLSCARHVLISLFATYNARGFYQSGHSRRVMGATLELLNSSNALSWPTFLLLANTYFAEDNTDLLIASPIHACCRYWSGHRINNNSSAVQNHSSTTGHYVSPEDFSNIRSASNRIDLLIHESLLIRRDRPALNFQTSSIQLTLF